MSIISLINFLKKKSKNGVIFSGSLISIFNVLGIPLLIEEITERIGNPFLAVGTGLMYQISSFFCGIFIYFIGIALDNETKIASLFCLVFISGIVLCVFFLSIFAEIMGDREFKSNEGYRKLQEIVEG